MTSLSSCKAPQIKSQVRLHVDFEHNICAVRCYSLMQQKDVDDVECGAEFISAELPIESCHGVVGFDVKVIARDINPWLKETVEHYEDTCEK